MADADDSRFEILLVEDEPVIRELVKTMLSEGDVHVECAATGTEGLKLAKTRPFRLMLLDVVVPQLDGVSLCRIIKSDPALARTPVYMLTGKSKRSDVEAATRAGADGYIQKPFRGAELMDLVARLRGV